MADLVEIVGEEEGGNSGLGRKLTLKELLSFSKAKAHLNKHIHRGKAHKRKLSRFERRFSILARDNALHFERKRIDYVLVHEKKLTDSFVNKENTEVDHRELDRKKFMELLLRDGFTVQTSQVGKYVYTKLYCPFKRMCLEAERVKFEMPIQDCPRLESTRETFFTQFINKHFETDDEDDFISTGFTMSKIEKFRGHDNPNTFFRPAVRSFLTHHILMNMNIDQLDENLKEIQPTTDDQPCPQRKKGLAYMLMKGSYTDCFVLHDQSELSSVKGDTCVTDFVPTDMHNIEQEDRRKELDNTWTKPFKFQPLWKIRDYFGERIAFYFAWSGMLCTSLWIPSLFGLCVFFYGIYVSATTDDSSTTSSTNTTSFVESFKDLFGDFKQSFDNDVTPYFGLTICVWGTVFLEIWKRKNAELAYEWDVEQFEANEPDRPSFSGTKSKKDPVTEELVWYYPFRRQFFKFCLSFSIVILMIVLVLISVVAIITYRVIMTIDYCPDLAAAECLMVTTILSSLLNAISILLLTRVYNKLARWLTEWENHRTQTQYDNALIFKLFAFQFINSYASCFYIAFFRGRFDSVGFLDSDRYEDSCEGSCMTQLSFQVLVLMVVKPFPKFFKDIVLVWIKKMWRKHPGCCQCLRRSPCCRTTNQVTDADLEDGNFSKKNSEHCVNQLQFLKHEHLKPALEDFTLDEFTEKIIQYGFLMLFAASFPLAPFLALVTNMIDLRVDAKRLLWWYRRPIAHVAQDIGMWYQILLFVNFCGVVSNAFLIAFTSSWGADYSTVGKLLIVIGFEHLVFVLKYIVAYLIPDVPAYVQLSIRREKYQIQKKMEDPRRETDFAHLFPVDQILEMSDEDADDNSQNLRKRLVSEEHKSSSSSSKQREKQDSPVRDGKREESQAPHKRTAEEHENLGGYVSLSQQEQLKHLNQKEDLWYCGLKADSPSSAARASKPSGNNKFTDPNADSFYDRYSDGAPSNFKSQGKNNKALTNEPETTGVPATGLQSPANPISSTCDLRMFSGQTFQPPSGSSSTEC